MAKDADAASTEDAAGTDDNKEQDGSQEGAEGSTDSNKEFDPERAMATIKKQRESEAALKADLKALREDLAKYKSAEEQEAEAQKTLETKVAERDLVIKDKDAEIADLHVRYSFERDALERGVADPALAFLAAKEQGFLGQYDPKAGTVTDHDWDALGEKYPSFASQEDGPKASTGDAGARGKGKTATPGAQFNDAIRGAVRGRRGV